MNDTVANHLINLLEGGLEIKNGEFHIPARQKLRTSIHKLAEVAAIETGSRQSWAQYLIRMAALEAGVIPASIHDLYMARGRGEIPPTFTVPAVNLRALTFDGARAVFRTMLELDATAVIFEIARSEIGYTSQRPAEYSASVLAAAIAEGYQGPVFIQGDHFQVSPKRYSTDPVAEIDTLKNLMKEAVAAGFYNIDVDASTLVDLKEPNVPAQQRNNIQLTAMFTYHIRGIEVPGVTISIGGEIGEVGGQNSTEEELCAFLEGYNDELNSASGGVVGLSKISIQTGTSHGGVVLPDGTIAEAKVDFDTLKHLSRVAREEFQLGGAVQHGASTLPEEAFGKFVDSEAIEIHLATNFMNMFFDHAPIDLKEEMYAYLREKHASERKADMTDEQFYYKTRKNVVGTFKTQSWKMPIENKAQLTKDWQDKFRKLFTLLGAQGTRKFVEDTVHPLVIRPNLRDYLGEALQSEEVSDLAD